MCTVWMTSNKSESMYDACAQRMSTQLLTKTSAPNLPGEHRRCSCEDVDDGSQRQIVLSSLPDGRKKPTVCWLVTCATFFQEISQSPTTRMKVIGANRWDSRLSILGMRATGCTFTALCLSMTFIQILWLLEVCRYVSSFLTFDS